MRVTWGGQGGHDIIEVHHLALWSVGLYRKENEHASHLCGNLNCFNISYLLWESHKKVGWTRLLGMGRAPAMRVLGECNEKMLKEH